MCELLSRYRFGKLTGQYAYSVPVLLPEKTSLPSLLPLRYPPLVLLHVLIISPSVVPGILARVRHP